MKEFLSKNLDWFADQIKAYGFWIIAVLFLVWLGRKVWFWVGLPLMLASVLPLFGAAQDWSAIHFVLCWVFSMSILKKIGEALFER